MSGGSSSSGGSRPLQAITRAQLATILNGDEHNNKLLVVEFVEPRNEACESMRPEVEEIASRFADDAEFYELDCNSFKFFMARLKVAAVPMFVLMRKCKVEEKWQCKVEDIVVGVRKGELERSIQKYKGRPCLSLEPTGTVSLLGFPPITVPLSHYRPPLRRFRYKMLRILD